MYQLLANEMGIDHWKVSVGYGILQAVVGIGALLIRGYGTVVLVGYLGAWRLCARIGKDMTENEIGKIIVDAAVKVHQALGPGLLETVYDKMESDQAKQLIRQ